MAMRDGDEMGKAFGVARVRVVFLACKLPNVTKLKSKPKRFYKGSKDEHYYTCS